MKARSRFFKELHKKIKSLFQRILWYNFKLSMVYLTTRMTRIYTDLSAFDCFPLMAIMFNMIKTDGLNIFCSLMHLDEKPWSTYI